MLSEDEFGCLSTAPAPATQPPRRRLRGPDDPTRLSRWFPLIAAAGLPVPKTEIVRVADADRGALGRLCFDSECGEGPVEAGRRLADAIGAAADRVAGEGCPFFLRTDFTSAKHGWKDTCFVADRNRLMAHVAGLVEFSECADMMGLPWDVFAVRELLPTVPLFTAFSGRMPIVREFRFFVEGGKVSSFQPYWPEFSIAVVDYRGRVSEERLAQLRLSPSTGSSPDADDWRDRLAAAAVLADAERTHLGEQSIRAANACAGEHLNWSVDWLATADRGWVLTDMAVAEHSYRYDPSAPPTEDDL